MWIGGAEGIGYRYEVVALTDGYVVQMRDMDTGAIEPNEARIFKTARVAFAHAQAMAAIDRFAATVLDMQDASSEQFEAERCEATLRALQERLNDQGCGYPAPPQQTRPPCVYH
ncbi:hypothetical protein [Terrarubrum flagellatum]|uniref:hypothetical protein n=1 Tax=Terrirubrum flagellatum TaxID=2895980 RepID=UPI0031455671